MANVTWRWQNETEIENKLDRFSHARPSYGSQILYYEDTWLLSGKSSQDHNGFD